MGWALPVAQDEVVREEAVSWSGKGSGESRHGSDTNACVTLNKT